MFSKFDVLIICAVSHIHNSKITISYQCLILLLLLLIKILFQEATRLTC